MPNPRLTRWRDPDRDQGLLLFAQRLEELVFDYAPDSYKVRALNTHTRTLELDYWVGAVRREGLPKPILIPMVQELADSIRTDTVAKALLGPHANRFGHYASWDVDSVGALSIQVRHLLSVLAPQYEGALTTQLRDVIPEGRRKRAICDLTAALAVEWLNRGLSRGYLYASVRDFFFLGGGQEVSGVDSFDSFLTLFAGKTAKWTVIVRGSKDLKRLGPALQSTGTLHNSPPAPRSNAKRELQFLNAAFEGVWVAFDDVEAYDARAALDRATSVLRGIGTFATLHAHGLMPDSDGGGVVYGADGSAVVLAPTVPPVRKHPQGRGRHLANRMKSTAGALGRAALPRDSFRRVLAALRLHATALRAPSHEEQLYALWIALETLLPFEDAESRIGRMVDVLVPLLAREYPLRLIENLHATLHGCVGEEYDAAQATLPKGMTALERCAALVAAADAQAQRDTLFAACGRNPLLRHRLYVVSESLLDSNRILDTIKAHEQRVAWHLRRIYRTRNALVHTGRRLPYLESLVENLHAYVWRVIELTEGAFKKEPPPKELDGALLSARVDHECHLQVLRRAGGEPTTVANAPLHVLGALS